MAELNVTRRDDETVPDARLVAGDTAERTIYPDPLLTEHTHATPVVTPEDPELARMQIEQTRARMSSTIDQIEGALLRKKENIEERLDVMAPVRRKARENPYPVIGGVFLAGLVLGLLTGGDDDEHEPAVRRFAVDFDAERAHGYHWQERARTWERRARRLMDLANRQEAELLEMQGESVPVKRGRGRRLFGRGRDRGREGNAERSYGTGGYVDTDTELDVDVGMEERSYARPSRTGYDGMPLHEADSAPPRGEDDLGGSLGRDPLPSPI